MTKRLISDGLVGSDRFPAKFANKCPRPDLPFEEEPPKAWPYLFEAVLWTALLCLGVWGLVEGWK
jgi:hypothetical protein